MKSLSISLAATLLLALSTNAALLVDEPFDYPDGPLVPGSGGVWVTHSGTVPNQVNVQAGQVNLTQAESEDVSRSIPGAPYGTNGWLYYRFTLTFTGLPSGDGTYFAHFKDSSTGFRAKLFATVTNAAAGTFRLGIANGAQNTPVTVPLDLALNIPYLVVVRYNTTNASSTLWLNPTSEESVVNRAEGADNTSALPIVAFALRQSSSIGVMNVDDLKIGTAFTDVVIPGDPSQNAPVVSAIGNQSVAMNQPTPAIPFTVNDGATDPANLVLTATASNPTLVPEANIVLGGSGTDRTITVTPAPGQQGQALISITVTDGDNNQTIRSFILTVGAPSISSVPNQITQVSTPTAPIPFTVSDAETPAASLTLSAWSSNPTLIPPANVIFGGSGSNRTAVITPPPGMRGSAEMGFVVSDGSSTATNRFMLTVAPTVPQDIDEHFAYPDGLVQDVSVQLWSVFSPTSPSNDCRVVSGRLLLASTNYDDVRYYVGFYDLEGNGYYSTNGGYVLYYSLTLNVSQLPPASTYFALLKDSGNINYRARAFVTTNGAAPGHYRLGVAAATATPSALLTNDLVPGANYTLTIRYNVGTGDTRLWLNALNETSPGVDAADSGPLVDIWNFAFRQNNGLGALFVDNVKVGSAWPQVFQAPNWPPTISSLPDVTTPYQTPTPPLPFTVGDQETPPDDLTFTATSSNPALVPENNIILGGFGANRTVTITPASGQSGQTRVSITVTDAGGNGVTTSFLVTVLGLNNPPSLSAIPNQSTVMGIPTSPIPFTISDRETPPESLLLSGYSDNPTLVPPAAIVFGGEGSNRTVTLTPAPGHSGVANISVVVSDGVFHTTNTFLLTVGLNILLADDFSYADGSIITNSSFLWKAHSGATGQTWVVGGQLLLSGGQSEDISAALTNAPYYPSNAPRLYAGFTIRFSTLPTNAYFAHFKDATTGFRCRVFASSNNASPGTFRIGVANAAAGLGATNPPLARDLVLNTAYRVVVRYDLASGLSTLWVNPASEGDPSVSDTNAASSITVMSFAFRQASALGELAVDDLIVAGTFDTARGELPAGPPLIHITRHGSVLRLEWPASATMEGYRLQRCTSLGPGSWETANLPVETDGSTSYVSITNPTGDAFFRLAK